MSVNPNLNHTSATCTIFLDRTNPNNKLLYYSTTVTIKIWPCYCYSSAFSLGYHVLRPSYVSSCNLLSTVITFTRHRTPLLLYPLYRRENLTTTHLPEVYTAGNHTTKTALRVKTLQKQRYLVTISLHGEIHSTLCLPLHCHLCSPAVIVTTPRSNQQRCNHERLYCHKRLCCSPRTCMLYLSNMPSVSDCNTTTFGYKILSL